MGLLLMPVYVTVPRAWRITEIGLWVSLSPWLGTSVYSVLLVSTLMKRKERETSFGPEAIRTTLCDAAMRF
jgi:hypothetical protein